ncbi:feruloyl-CoA synthase [Pantoea sp. Ap-967]|uniref:feruloyl-CoA synthase n=1 Tax=Pantoea sp. Ap-967 TaxID=2608362 RepID=UPI00141EAD26|nr:feruloyl-CoA synthase [Pantoea sp. Ap-967]NIE72935.1 feruloyl-CoA synthase [Pantoea sp. Ap-967]
MYDFHNDPTLLAPAQVLREARADGSFVLKSPHPLLPYARCMGEWLEHWAAQAPERVFLAERRGNGWFKLTYGEVRRRVGELAQGLLELNLQPGRPVLMLSENDIDQALLTLAAMHVGIPVSTVSVAYSRNTAGGCKKLRAIIDVLQPAVVFVSDGDAYFEAIRLTQPQCLVVAARNAQEIHGAVALPLLYKPESAAVMSAFQQVDGTTPARYLLTSGSTGSPKAVINTHGMLCANQQAIAQCWRFLEHCELVVLDWLPWSHVFGANHNFNLVLRNGGTLYIDDGLPLPGQIDRTVENIKSVKPTVFFNVPRGYEVLLPYLERDEELSEALFGRLHMLFYAAAALPQSSWDRLVRCAAAVRSQPLFFATAWGATETSPVVTSMHFASTRAGIIGLPIPGTELKFVPSGDKLEMRVRGPSVFPRYLDDPANTVAAFDEEGFYRIGDAGRLVEQERPELGVLFDGRVTEDFKLTSGTWVSVGTLRTRLVSALAPYASDCVICGHDRDVICALVYPTPALRELLGREGRALSGSELAMRAEVRLALCAGLQSLAKAFPASSQHAARLIILDSPPSLADGEITDKGYINQRAALALHADAVQRLYAENLGQDVILLAEVYGETA